MKEDFLKPRGEYQPQPRHVRELDEAMYLLATSILSGWALFLLWVFFPS